MAQQTFCNTDGRDAEKKGRTRAIVSPYAARVLSSPNPRSLTEKKSIIFCGANSDQRYPPHAAKSASTHQALSVFVCVANTRATEVEVEKKVVGLKSKKVKKCKENGYKG